jgi:hypothetical protein
MRFAAMPANPITQDALWCALYELGNDLGDSDIGPAVAAELIKLNIAERRDDGSLALTAYGEKAIVVMESGDGSVTEFNDYRPVGE